VVESLEPLVRQVQRGQQAAAVLPRVTGGRNSNFAGAVSPLSLD